MKLYDDHLHLRPHTAPPQPHALKPLLEKAEERGVIAHPREHPPIPRRFRFGPHEDYEYAMNENETDTFLGLFRECGCPVGFEVDYISGEEDEIQSILKSLLDRAAELGVPVSGIHGSVHLLPGDVKDIDWPKGDVRFIVWDLDENVFLAHLADRGPERILHEYFSAMLDLVDLGIYDALSHIDVIRKFDRRNSSGESIYFSEYERLYAELSRRVIERISETDMAIEINTAGFFSPIGRPYISQELLNYAVELKVPICLGSDAHIPERIGAHFDFALQMLEKAACDKLVTFENRRKSEYSPF